MLSSLVRGADEGPQLARASEARSGDGPYCRVLTAGGRGAIAVIRVWGVGAIEAVSMGFRANAGTRLAERAPGRLVLGRMGAGLGDEVVAVVLEAGIPTVEIQCHGGTAAVGTVLLSLERAGVQVCERGAPAASDYPAVDALSAEALEDLAFAPTVVTAEILLDQVHGALGAEIARLAVLVEQEPAVARAGLDALIERGAFGLRLVSGWKVVIAGRPNVGKSRLLNALCGFPRAIVDGAPGTTRDVVAFQTALGGWPILLSDTAGLRATDDAIETLGIERAQRELESADLVLLVLDRSESLRSIDRQLIATESDALVVANKSDLAPAWLAGDIGRAEATVVAVSAERGDGMEWLVEAMIERIVPVAPKPGEAIPFRSGQLEQLGKARAELLAGNTVHAARELETLILGGRERDDLTAGIHRL